MANLYVGVSFGRLDHMRDTELRKERDEDVYAIYCLGLAENLFRNMDDAADWVRGHRAKKFYVSAKTLVNYIGVVDRGTPPQCMFEGNERKMRHLYNMYRRYIQDNPGTNMSRERICEILVDSEAPEFYIGRQSIQKIILFQRKAHRKLFIERYSK